MLWGMGLSMVLQGRVVTAADLDQIRTLQTTHPGWSRRQVSVALATAWDWRTAAGRLKDMAARTLLGKLEARGRLPSLKITDIDALLPACWQPPSVDTG